jgi:isopenicillin N synthase-like dioxygenase
MARTTDRAQLPVVDLGRRPGVGAAAALQDAARQLDAALRDVGAFEVVGHGIPADLIRRTMEASNELFALSRREKEALRSPTGNPFQGYTTREVGDPPVLIRESYESGRFDTPEDVLAAGYGPEHSELVEPNVWPRRPRGFRAAMTTYHAVMEELGDRLLSIAAIALGLRPDWFRDRFDRQASYLACVHYPPQFVTARDRMPRMGPHADFGTLSIFAFDEAPGRMQVHVGGTPEERARLAADVMASIADPDLDLPEGPNPDLPGTWVEVAGGGDRLLVCAGEMLARWTDDRWSAALHRVASPTDRDPALSRTALAYYQYPNLDTEIAALPTCLPPGATPRQPPVLAGVLAHQRKAHRHPWF